MPADEDTCGKWMPRARVNCARMPEHRGECRTAAAMADTRARKTERRRGALSGRAPQNPEVKARWRKAYRLRRYNITQKQFDWLLEVQGYACAMGAEPFTENSVICVDHDHSCCPEEKQSCGKCIRGLLCLDCNTTLGKIERKLRMAQVYLAAPPGKIAMLRSA